MSPTAIPAGMTLPAYLDQAEVWVDGRSRTVFGIAELDERRRGYAARELARAATAYISAMETLALINGDLVEMVALITTSPRTWITSTALYRALSANARPDAGDTVTVDSTRVVVDFPPSPRTMVDGHRLRRAS